MNFMKKIITFLFFIITAVSFSQNYKLFTANSKKLFTDYPIPLNTYSLSFDTVKGVNNDSVYYNFSCLNNYWIISDTCEFWGQDHHCIKQTAPTAMGGNIIFDNVSNYQFFNLNHDSLTFNFTKNPNDTLIFYIDALQKFLFVYKKTDTLNVLSNTDSARFYTIIHKDLTGNIINSALNQQSIIISKNFGLMRFFQVDSFPQLLKPVVLMGNVSPNAGRYKVTNEDLYDYQPGDEFQYHEYYFHAGNPPEFNHNIYIKYTILSRNMTNDSIIYKAIHEHFSVDTAQFHVDTVQLKYYRHTVIAHIPFELINGGYYFNFGSTKHFGLSNYCGLKLWTYTYIPQYNLEYCALDTCWGQTEYIPPMYPIITTRYVVGLGIYTDESSLLLPPPTGYLQQMDMVYFKKNGIICGTDFVLGIHESITDKKISIYPNPATSSLWIEGLSKTATAEVFDMSGKILLKKQLNTNQIDICTLAKGLYFIKLTTEEGSVVRKFVKE
jgi:hypothetical protein